MASTNKTSKVQLNQWVGTDPVLMADFNADNLKIENEFAAVRNEMAQFGLRYYTGSGQYGSANPITVSFDFAPKVVIVGPKNNPAANCIFTQGETTAIATPNGEVFNSETVSWTNNGKTLTWYASHSGDTALNQNNTVYRCMALA